MLANRLHAQRQQISTNIGISIAVFNAQNSEPNVDVSMLFCFLLYHRIGDLLKQMRTPVRERRVSISHAWSASTNTVICTGLPSGTGHRSGIALFRVRVEWSPIQVYLIVVLDISVIKHQPRSIVASDVRKHVKNRIQMTFFRCGRVRSHHRRLAGDINPSEFNRTPTGAYQLIPCNIATVRRCIKLGMVVIG